MVDHINDGNFEEEVLKAKGVVVVDFFATWCAPCKMLAPILEEISEEVKEAKIVKIDVDENPLAANLYHVSSIPTIKIFKDGELKDSKVGFQPKEFLQEAIEELI
ncbi:MAG: thioredoxin [Clostridium sp.]|nr:thioredoxin [Clostridium sp.]